MTDKRDEILAQGKNPFEDSRGTIINYELTEPINLVGLITSKKGSIRGNHYHPLQEQKCLLISGSYISVYKDLSDPNSNIKYQLVEAGDLSIMPPMVAHAMIFLEDSILINLVNGDRDHDKFGEHTKKYELVNEVTAQDYISKYIASQNEK